MSAGTTPRGASDEKQASAWVQRMFSDIAPRYDLLNHLLSFNIDRGWRKLLVARVAAILERPDAHVLDLCCGTGDVLLDLQRSARTKIIGADFCHPMLVTADSKARKRGFEAPLIEADAMQMPLADESLDAITIAFGFRNLVNYEAGLREMLRILKPGGVLAVLEFSHPSGWFMRIAYGFYSGVFLPLIGRLLSGSREAYSYLPESVSKFPTASALRDLMLYAGFADARFELRTGGIAALHLATKSTAGA